MTPNNDMDADTDAPLDAARLSLQLAEAVEALRAIRNGEVDALVVPGGLPGSQVFTLTTADRPYRIFVEAMRDGAATVSESGSVLYANRSLADILETPLSSILGAPLSSFVIQADRAALAEQHLLAGTGSTIEIRLAGAEGRVIPVRVASSHLTVDAERLLCLTFADLTQAHVIQEELRVAHEKAVEGSRLKSEFVANMSHEIRTPLNGVTGMTDLLLDTPLTLEQREYVDAVRESSDVLLTVINEILDFSKIEAGKLELDETPFAVADLVESACSAVAIPAHAKGVELLSWIDEQVPAAVCGDANRVRQVLTNLLTNAVKFTATGEIVVKVTSDVEGGQRRLNFAVRDTGIGVEPGAAARIFDSFAQADGSTTRRYGGTGLGLTISKKLVELMGGTIGVDSSVGCGSTFWFTVVVGSVDGGAELTRERGLDGVRVLAVDDNDSSRTQLARYCTSWGMDFRSSPSGLQALEMLSAAAAADTPYDIVLVDADMPGMSGRRVAKAIRASAFAHGVRIVLLESSQGGREEDRQVGVNGFASKPIRSVRLHEELVRVLRPGAPERDDVPPTCSGVPVGDEREPRLEPTAVAPRSREPTFDGRAVLLAEDNEINQRVTVRILERHGLHVDVAPNGQIALDMHARRHYAAIFMDCQMPEVDGFEATAEIRRRETAQRIPIIALTANTMSGDRQRCLDAGMDDYVGKPLGRQAVDDAIVRWLGTGSEDSSAARPADDEEAAKRAPALNYAVLDEVCGDDVEVRRDLLHLFSRNTASSIDQIRRAASVGDATALVLAAHSLKGASASVGARRMALLSDQLCRLGRTGSLAAAPTLLRELTAAATLTEATWFASPIDGYPAD